VKPDDAYWKAVAGPRAGQAIAALGGKYLKGPTSHSTIADLTEFCDLNWITSLLSQPASVNKGTVTTVSGTQVLPLTDPVNKGTLYVTNTGGPLPVELVNSTTGKKGALAFGVGAPVSLAAPPASETVDGSKYGL
jgi:hypothetical protein